MDTGNSKPDSDRDMEIFDPKTLGYEGTIHRSHSHSRSPLTQNFTTPNPLQASTSITPLINETENQSVWEIFAFICPVVCVPLIFLCFYDQYFLWILVPILLLGIISIYISLIVPKFYHKNQAFLSQPNQSTSQRLSSPVSTWT